MSSRAKLPRDKFVGNLIRQSERKVGHIGGDNVRTTSQRRGQERMHTQIMAGNYTYYKNSSGIDEPYEVS